jgi:hypothetical protein
MDRTSGNIGTMANDLRIFIVVQEREDKKMEKKFEKNG